MILSGEVSLDDDLGELVGVLTAIRTVAINDPEADYSHLIRMAAAERRLTPLDEYTRVSASSNGHRHHRLLTRLTMAGAALALVVTMSGGLAYAANGAKPGDLLYGLDRALEGIGIGDGGEGERLSESIVLAQADADSDADAPLSALAAPAPTSSIDTTAERRPTESGDVGAPWLLPNPIQHPRETQFPGVPDAASESTDAAGEESTDAADDSSIGGSPGRPDESRSSRPDPPAGEERRDGGDNTESPPADDATEVADDGPTEPPEPAVDEIDETKSRWGDHPGITNHASQASAACYQGKVDKAHAKLAKYREEIDKMEAGRKLSAEMARLMRIYADTLQALFDDPEMGCPPLS
jgi:hypothetical protein